MIPGAGAMPSVTGGAAGSGVDGDTSQSTSSAGSGLQYSRGNGIPAWVIALGMVVGVGGLVAMTYLKAGK